MIPNKLCLITPFLILFSCNLCLGQNQVFIKHVGGVSKIVPSLIICEELSKCDIDTLNELFFLKEIVEEGLMGFCKEKIHSIVRDTLVYQNPAASGVFLITITGDKKDFSILVDKKQCKYLLKEVSEFLINGKPANTLYSKISYYYNYL